MRIAHDHTSLSVADLDKQRAFYAHALGLNQVEEEFAMPEAGVRSTILRSADGMKLELVERTGSAAQSFADPYEGAGTQGYFHWAVQVDDLTTVFDHVLGAGATVVSPPADAVQPGARFAYVHDPEGNLLELIQPAAQ